MERYRKVRQACFGQGLSKRRIVRDFGISPGSVDKMPTCSVPPGYPGTPDFGKPTTLRWDRHRRAFQVAPRV